MDTIARFQANFEAQPIDGGHAGFLGFQTSQKRG